MPGFTLYPEELENIPIFTKNKSHLLTKLNKVTTTYTSHQKHLEDDYHSNRVNKAFLPLRITLAVLGRWPFHLETRQKVKQAAWSFSNAVGTIPDTNSDLKSPKLLKFQVYSSSVAKAPFLWIYFCLTTIFLLTVLILSTLGFCDFFLEWNLFPTSPIDGEEKKHFESNLVPFVLVWSCLMHSSISSVSLFLNRKKVANFLNYWNTAVDSMDIDLPKGIKMYVFLNYMVFLVFLIIIFVAYKIMYLNLIRGGSTLMGILTFRPFISELLTTGQDLWKLRVFGMVTIIYAIFSSRMFLLFFSFNCKLLKHAMKIWNRRFKQILKFSHIGYTEEQKQCEKIFEDYRIILKLVRLTDIMFGAVLQSYYGSQLLNMCFELYYIARSGSYDEDIKDVFGALLVLIQNIYIFFTVSLDAAYVNEEAMKGFDILRSYGVNPDDTIYKKYLASKMQTIFSQRIVLTGGKFFSVDRPFIVTVLGAVFTYFIIVLQVGPSLHKKFEEDGSFVGGVR